MTRLFLSLYAGLLTTLFAFFIIAHLINSYLIIDVENVIDAQNFSAEINLLEKLDKNITLKERNIFLKQIAESNQSLIQEINLKDIPKDIQEKLEEHQVWFDDEEFNYFSAFSPIKYFEIEQDENNELNKVIDKIDKIILLVLVSSFAICCFIWLFNLHHKLTFLEKILIEISQGNLSARASVKNKDKVGKLNKNINNMAEKIEHLLGSHKRLTNAIAHEIRSPLFRMHMQIGLLEQDQPTISSEHIKGLEEEVFNLEEMVDELLSYAKMERADIQLNLENLSVNNLVRNLCTKLKSECKSTLHYSDNTNKTCLILADDTLIKRCLTNLIRNAEKYGHSQIDINITQQSNSVIITIGDDGDGINTQQRKDIFKPFYRIDDTDKSIGFGLGLTIVKEIIQRHSGTVSVSSCNLGGALFVLEIPLQ